MLRRTHTNNSEIHAPLFDVEYEDLVRRWKTMKGLHSCVPVRFIIPQAVLCPAIISPDDDWILCHIHESDDSYLTGVDYLIPESENGTFSIDGVQITFAEACELLHREM